MTRPHVPSTRESRGEEGFLYIEVLGSLFMFAVAMLAIVPIFTLAAYENAAAGDITYATLAVQELAEEFKAAELSTLASGNDTLTLYGVTFSRTWTVTADAPQTGMTTIALRVVPDRKAKIGGNRAAEVTFYREN